MVKYKLTYLNLKWLGEPVRFMLSYMGKEFEDCRITPWPNDHWPEMRKKIPFGRVPTLEIDGKLTYQSAAICRYLAVEAGLNGKNDWENLEIDMTIGTLSDFIPFLVSFYKEEDAKKKEEKGLHLLKEIIPYYYGLYDEQIKKNGGFLANNSLSWADLYFAAWSESMDFWFKDDIDLDQYPNLKGLKEKVYSIPNIKKWRETRPQSE